MINIFTVDLEDWRHIHYLNSEDEVPERLEENTGLILDVLQDYDVKATFFIVGELAENYPSLIRKILKHGHEIGFHTYHHTPLWDHSRERLEEEIRRFRKLMKENFNVGIYGFRAPLFSLNRKTSWAIEVLERENFLYDSSIFPIWNPVYGEPKAPRTPYFIKSTDITRKSDSGIIEFPLLTYRFLTFNIPAAGGIYLRFLPERIIFKAIEKFNASNNPTVIYIHPREVDPSPPKLKLSMFKEKLFTYKTKETLKKVENLLKRFQFTSAINYIRGWNIE
ncbi:MAG: hypothetical protein DRJ38_03670 [Thermoprotei archaeon]|nr:MAG: hypothetical protein DRJ38_03670 [Thermoprotei archaeon]